MWDNIQIIEEAVITEKVIPKSIKWARLFFVMAILSITTYWLLMSSFVPDFSSFVAKSQLTFIWGLAFLLSVVSFAFYCIWIVQYRRDKERYRLSLDAMITIPLLIYTGFSTFKSIDNGRSSRSHLCDDTAKVCIAIWRPFRLRNKKGAYESDTVESDEWGLDITIDDLSDHETREKLSQYWLENAKLEYASIATFSRLTLELMYFWAPSELIELSNSATTDEIRHSKLCFSLATVYSGNPVGPWVFTGVSGEIIWNQDLSVLATESFVDGSFGEWLAARLALEASRIAEDTSIQEVFAQIAEDESRHAELGWKIVEWILGSASKDDIRSMLQESLINMKESIAQSEYPEIWCVVWISEERFAELQSEVYSEARERLMVLLQA